MKLFKTTRWSEPNDGISSGYSKFFVCVDDKEELEMYKWLSEQGMRNDVVEIDIDNVSSITDLYGLSLKDLKKLLDNM